MKKTIEAETYLNDLRKIVRDKIIETAHELENGDIFEISFKALKFGCKGFVTKDSFVDNLMQEIAGEAEKEFSIIKYSGPEKYVISRHK